MYISIDYHMISLNQITAILTFVSLEMLHFYFFLSLSTVWHFEGLNMGWRILVFYPEPEAKDKIY